MAPPPLSLEQTVSQHGDTLYRIALLLADEPRRAEQALRRTVQLAAQSGVGGDLLALLRLLLGQLDLQRRGRRWPWQRPRAQRFSTDGPLYRGPGVPAPFTSMPFEQRRALAIHLLLGYDAPLLARLLDSDEAQARDELAQAFAALAGAGGIRLPSVVSGPQCAPVRALLQRDRDQLAHEATLRGHLALCSLCRAFDATWEALGQQAEAALRNGLRHHALPRTLATSLAAISRTEGLPRSWWDEVLAGGRTSFIAVSLAVLLLIGALVLPGFLRGQQLQPAGAMLPMADERTLVQRALALIDQPPPGAGVWHGSWETVWYFPNGSYAPIHADAWLDTSNPARHRLQVVHGGGGALYELQVGDGGKELWYAIGATYHSSLYGALGSDPPAPQLIRRALDATAQREAASARFRSGIWGIGPAYLREAYHASDLRTLGRQPLDDRTVQIVSFVAPSPLGFPADDPQAAPVTILLGLDTADGRLRSVTELTGPPGGEQTSRVTWRLRGEEWLRDETAIRQAFDPRAWNGRGSFPPKAEGTSLDSALLLYTEAAQLPLEQLFAHDILAPDGPPPGAKRLLSQRIGNGTTPLSYTLTYLGEGRQLTLSWRVVTDTSRLGAVGTKLAAILPARNQHYRAIVAPQSARFGPDLGIVLDAQGFSYDDLAAFIGAMRPFSLEGWQQQQPLGGVSTADPLLREMLVQAVGKALRPSGGEVLFRRERVFMRRPTSNVQLNDPYHAAPGESFPETLTREQWVAISELTNTPEIVRVNRLSTAGGVYAIQRISQQERWSYAPTIKLLERWRGEQEQLPTWRSERTLAAYDLLMQSDPAPVGREQADGRWVISAATPLPQSVFSVAASRQVRGEPLPVIPSDVSQIITELTLDASGQPVALRYSGSSGAGSAPLLLASWELEEERLVPIDGAPPELRTNTAPFGLADLVNDYNGPAWPLLRQTVTLTDALAFGPLYTLPASSTATLSRAEVRADPEAVSRNPADAGTDEVGRGLAVRLGYNMNGDWRRTLLITQGPAGPLRAYFRTRPPTWVKSSPVVVSVAGREVAGWLLEGPPFTINRLVVEIDGTLLMAEGSAAWFGREAIPLLAMLQRQ